MDLPIKQIVVFFIEMLQKQKQFYEEANKSNRSTRHVEKCKLASHPWLLYDNVEMEGNSCMFLNQQKQFLFRVCCRYSKI